MASRLIMLELAERSYLTRPEIVRLTKSSWNRNEIVALTPKAFDTLLLLVRNSGHLLEKDELINSLWPETFVEEGSLSNNIFLLRKALGEDPAFIATVPRRGYRFIARVVEIDDPPDPVKEPVQPPEAPAAEHASALQPAPAAHRDTGRGSLPG